MAGSEDLRIVDNETLAYTCIQETEKFLQQLSSDSRHCFELFRRAYSELRDEALSHIYNIYIPLLARHARRHPLYFQSCQNDEYFARVALSSFYRVNRGAQFETKFSFLEAVIKYLFACLHSAIVQDVRENAQLSAFSPEEVAESLPFEAKPSTDALDTRELWEHILRLLPEAEYQRLAYLRFVLAMKPAEIVKNDSQTWSSEREVTVALQSIRRRLRKDPWLRQQAGHD